MGKYIGGRCLELMPETIKKYPPQPCKQKSNDAALVLLGTPPKTPKNWWFLDVSPFNKGVFSSSILSFPGKFYSIRTVWGGCAGLIELTTFPSGIETPAAESSLHWNPHPTVDANAVMPREDGGRHGSHLENEENPPPPVFGDHPGSLRIHPDTVDGNQDFQIFQKWQTVYRVTSVHKI